MSRPRRKTLSPGLRIAYLLAPGQAQAMRLTAALRATAMASSGLLSGIVTAWIKSGQANRDPGGGAR